MKPFDLWMDFVNKNPKYMGKDYKVFAFGDNPNELVKLVLIGEKTATSSLYSDYKVLPRVGDISILIDSKGDAKCILQNTNVSIVSFNDVTSDHAQKEGEGDKTLDYWKKAHLKFWGDVSPNEKIVCKEFRVVFISVC